MPFKDRNDAARRLAERLAGYRGRKPLVLAVPRGGVPMAAVVADALGGELDVVLVHKLGAPGNPELAVGQFFDRFEQVSDDEVVALLREHIGAGEPAG